MSNDGGIPFSVAGGGAPMMPNADNELMIGDHTAPLEDKIKALIGSGDIVLFMKGNVVQPQCGFSANTSQILNMVGKQYKTFNILSDEEIRQGLKEFSNWPTFPQLYIKGQFVGGNDIVTEMYESGELQELLQ